MVKFDQKKTLGAVIILSVLLRVAAAVYMGASVEDMPGTADQLSYHTLALRLLDGHGFTFGEPWWPATPAGQPTAHWSYLYTAYLTAVYAIFGPAPLAARLIQAVLVGVLQPLLAFWLGRRVFGELAGLAAAFLTAIYAYFIYYTGALMTEPFYITAILGSFVLAIMMADRLKADGQASLKLGASLGLVLGGAVLLRQLFLLFVPVIFLWILLSGRKQVRPLLAAGLVIVAMILPFTIFNYARFQRVVLLNTNAGFAFFWGNHPVYGTRFQPILSYKQGSYLDLIPPELRSLDEAALDQALLRRGIEFVIDDPQRYVLLSLSRIPSYFIFWPTEDSGAISNLSRVLSFGILWPFMLYGLLLSLRSKPGPFQFQSPGPLSLLWAFVLVYTLVHLLTWTLIRYRLPVDAVLLVFCGAALVDLAGRVPALRRWLALPNPGTQAGQSV